MDSLPADAMFGFARPMDVRLSPDGERVAVQTIEYDSNGEERLNAVYTVPTDGSREPHRLTRASGASTMKWSPDGSRLGVLTTRDRDPELAVSRGDPASSDEDPQPQLWVYDLDRGGDAHQLTDHPEGIREFDWGPAGDRVVVAARDPDVDESDGEAFVTETERLQHKLDGVGWLDSTETRLSVVDVESGASRQIDDAVGGGIREPLDGLHPSWHPSEDRIAFLAYHGENPDDTYVRDVYVADLDTDSVRRLTNGEYAADNPTWSPDGRRLAFTVEDPESAYVQTGVRVTDVATGASHSITDGLDRSLSWFQTVVWLDENRLLTVIGDEGWSRFVQLSADGGHRRVYDRQSREASITQFDAAGGTVAFARTHPREGVDVFTTATADLIGSDDSDPSPRRVTELNAELVSEYDHPETQRIDVEGGDGDRVEAIAFYPPTFDPTDPAESRPLYVSLHGGPRRFDYPHFGIDTAFWTTRGYVVLKVNYHGSTSYGQAFCEALEGRWNDIEVTDALAATEKLVESGWADPDQMVVGGFSHGAVLTAYLLAVSDRFAAGVAEFGLYDMRSAFGTDDCHRWWENELGVPWENPAAYDRASSITDVPEMETPLLLSAGADDERCPPTQAEQLHVSLRKRGVDSKLVVYDDTSHLHYYVARPDRFVHRLETMAEWFRRHDETDRQSS